MRLTRQTNYAVRMLMYCAANDGKLSRIPEIARAYGVSELFCSRFFSRSLNMGWWKLYVAAMEACASDVQHRTFRCSMLCV